MKDLLLPRLPGLVIAGPLMLAVAFGGWIAAGYGNDAVWLAILSDLHDEHAEWDCTGGIARDMRLVHDHASASVRARLRTPGVDSRARYDSLTTCMEMRGQ